jgi:hypothetical protein
MAVNACEFRVSVARGQEGNKGLVLLPSPRVQCKCGPGLLLYYACPRHVTHARGHKPNDGGNQGKCLGFRDSCHFKYDVHNILVLTSFNSFVKSTYFNICSQYSRNVRISHHCSPNIMLYWKETIRASIFLRETM